MPPTGQAEAHAGSSQCMHMRRTNLPSRSCTTVNAVELSSVSTRSGKLWACLHVDSQARQPMHLVISTRSAFSLLRLVVSIVVASPLAQEDFVDDGVLDAGFNLGEQAGNRQTAV